MRTDRQVKKQNSMLLPWIRRIAQTGVQQKDLKKMRDLWIMEEILHQNKKLIMHFYYMDFIIWNRQEQWLLFFHMVFCLEGHLKEKSGKIY